jgi:hypothetical protein
VAIQQQLQHIIIRCETDTQARKTTIKDEILCGALYHRDSETQKLSFNSLTQHCKTTMLDFCLTHVKETGLIGTGEAKGAVVREAELIEKRFAIQKW